MAMAKKVAVPVPEYKIELELTQQEAELLRTLLGWRISGEAYGRRRHCSEIYSVLVNAGVAETGTDDFSGSIKFTR